MRALGGTGIKVSSYCLGAMMFGAWGNPDHEDGIRVIHAALDGGINFIDTADVYSAAERRRAGPDRSDRPAGRDAELAGRRRLAGPRAGRRRGTPPPVARPLCRLIA
jgi:Aldo/keto reductase family